MKKKATSKTNVQKKKPKGKSKLPDGIPPLWPNSIKTEFAFCYYLLVDRIKKVARDAEKNPLPKQPTALIGCVHALCCLLRVRPRWPRHAELATFRILEWREIIESNLETSVLSLPEAARSPFLQSVKDDLDFLDEFMKRKRDRSVDLTKDD